MPTDLQDLGADGGDAGTLRLNEALGRSLLLFSNLFQVFPEELYWILFNVVFGLVLHAKDGPQAKGYY